MESVLASTTSEIIDTAISAILILFWIQFSPAAISWTVETFVEAPRFAGTCYRAAGWLRVGLTSGSTRNDDGRKPRTAPKAIYLKALRSDARRRLIS
jgi:hypothetical protein